MAALTSTRPLVAQEEATRSEIRHLVSRFFRNSHEDLVLNILEDRGMDPEELARLRRMLERSGGLDEHRRQSAAEGEANEPLRANSRRACAEYAARRPAAGGLCLAAAAAAALARIPARDSRSGWWLSPE